MGLTSNTGFYNPAAEKFGVDDPVMVKAPRMKYQFKLEFVLNSNVFMEDDSFGRTFTFDRVMSASMPDFDYGMQTLNQYNRMRHIPTRMTIGTCSISFYDTKDNQFSTLMKAYAGHYFGHEETGAHDLDPANFSGYNMLGTKFGVGDSHPFGAKSIAPDARFFFEEIRIHNRDTAQGGRSFALYNCMITAINHDTLAHSDSQPIQYSVSFQPEHFNVGKITTSMGDEAVAKSQAISTIPTNVSNRPTNPFVDLKMGVQVAEEIGRSFDGAPGINEVVRELNGATRIVPKGLPEDASADVGPT